MASIPEAFAIAVQHHQAGRFQAAEQIYRRILEIDPNYPDTLHLLGVMAHQLGKLELAVEYIGRAIAVRGDVADFHNNLGNVLHQEGKLADAIVCFRRAAALNPNLAEVHNNLGNALKDQRQFEAAAACYQRALELNPAAAETHSNLGNALTDQGKLNEAIECYRRSASLKPEFAEAHYNLGILLLKLGHYAEGWAKYESRLQCLWAPRNFSQPRWNGERTEGQTILIYSEQGFGDAIQFIRYASRVRARSGATRVILETLPGLVRLFGSNGDWGAEIVSGFNSKESALPPFDWQVPLVSLPLALGLHQPLPMVAPYLRADPDLRRAWRERLGSPAKIRVGLVWAGNPENIMDAIRSMPSEALLPLLQLPEINFYSLQLGPHSDAPSLAQAGLINLTKHISDFADTAAFVAELDLIISVDTGVAHLAGAMGQPVWMLLAFQSEWRWGMAGESTPWYPTLRLFRQACFGDWEELVGRVGGELRKMTNDE
jgi:Tfp pilus assembly protein PilF